MPTKRSIESIAFDACIGVAVLFFLYALLLPHFHPSPMQLPPGGGNVSAASNTHPATSSANSGRVEPAVASGDPSGSASAEVNPARPAADPNSATKAGSAPVDASDNLLPVMNYAVDAGMFQDQTNAFSLAKRIWTKYKSQAVITPLKVNNRTLYRVRLLVENKQKADNLARALLRDEKLQARVIQVQ